MVSTNDIRVGQVILIENKLMLILDHQHIKPGKGRAFVRTKLRNIETNSIVDKTFRADEDVESAYIDNEMYSFLFSNTNTYTFMNLNNYKQIELYQDFIGTNVNYLTENLEVAIKLYNNNPIAIELPPTVELFVTEAEPGTKGDTVSSASKVIVCETGLEVNVPLFINVGDKIKIDTKQGEYIARG